MYAVNCSRRSQIPDLRQFMPPKWSPEQDMENKLAQVKGKFKALAEKRKKHG